MNVMAWGTAEWALAVGLGSLMVSAGNLYWSIWSKFLHPKPKVAVEAHFPEDGSSSVLDILELSVTNHGPASVTIKEAIAIEGGSWWIPWKNKKCRIIQQFGLNKKNKNTNHDLPKELNVGEQYFISLLASKYILYCNHIGFIDTYGRFHKCDQKRLRELRRQLKIILEQMRRLGYSIDSGRS